MTKEQSQLTEKLLKHRSLSSNGTKILRHRALRRMPLSSAALQTAILLPLFVDVILWLNFDTIAQFWGDVMSFWLAKMDIGYSISHLKMTILTRSIDIPYPDFPTLFPSREFVIKNMIGCLLIALASFFIPKVHAPWIYLLRATLVIHGTAIIYFLINPNSFPYDMGSYVVGMLSLGQYALFLIPILMGMLYYILDFSFVRKVVVTVLMLGFSILMLPFQYLLYSIILASNTMLFMPLLYIMFGPLLNTLMFVCWYSWAMTWNKKSIN